MIVNLISHNNRVGLSADVEILTRYFIQHGHTVKFYEWRSRPVSGDVNIFIELVNPAWFPHAGKNFAFLNPEWTPAESLPHLQTLDKIFCKTHHATKIFESYGDCVHTGFTSFDRRRTGINKDKTFLHVHGKSPLKGTDTLMRNWPADQSLTLISSKIFRSQFKGVSLDHGYIPLGKLIENLNSHKFHFCPSESEGWGHYIVEAMSAGAVVITTNAEPMNELVTPLTGLLLEYGITKKHHMGTLYKVEPSEVKRAVDWCMGLNEESLNIISSHSRKRYEDIDARFQKGFIEIFNSSVSN